MPQNPLVFKAIPTLSQSAKTPSKFANCCHSAATKAIFAVISGAMPTILLILLDISRVGADRAAKLVEAYWAGWCEAADYIDWHVALGRASLARGALPEWVLHSRAIMRAYCART